ncbi:MAG: permease-like cell division protein FtsX [bacterium]
MTKLNTALSNLRRSPYQSTAAMLMTVITFFVISIFAIIVYSSQVLLQYFETRPQVTAFFHDATPESIVQNLQQQIDSTGLAKEYKYVSQSQALEIYKEQNKDNPMLLEIVTADILPASLEVSAHSVKDLDALATVLKNDSSVEDVIYQKDIIDTLKKWVDGIRSGGLVMATLLLVSSLVTIIVILGMRVAVRKTEIQTLSLLGASGWYIRAPFLYEALVYTLSGVVVGWGSSYLFLLYLTPNLLDFFTGINIFPIPYLIMLSILGCELVIGLVIGIVASLLTTRRYGK